MPLDLSQLTAPSHTALLTVEVQTGVLDEAGAVPALAQAVAEGQVLARIAALADTARTVGVPVVHCTVERRPDGQGSAANCRLLAALSTGSGGFASGSKEAAVHPDVGAAADDLVVPRLHGLSPMTGTEVDPILRNLGVTTIVATGVSVNVALLGLAFEAVNLGYQLVIPRDATAGVGVDYVDALYDNTLSLLGTITTTQDLLDRWSANGA